MRALKMLTVAMGVLIVVATALLAALIIRRATPVDAARATILAQPPGSHIVSIAATPAGLALLIQGGGADRVVVVDPRRLTVTGTLSLQR